MKVKNRKYQGEDEINNDILKYGCNFVVQQSQILIQTLITNTGRTEKSNHDRVFEGRGYTKTHYQVIRCYYS